MNQIWLSLLTYTATLPIQGFLIPWVVVLLTGDRNG